MKKVVLSQLILGLAVLLLFGCQSEKYKQCDKIGVTAQEEAKELGPLLGELRKSIWEDSEKAVTLLKRGIILSKQTNALYKELIVDIEQCVQFKSDYIKCSDDLVVAMQNLVKALEPTLPLQKNMAANNKTYLDAVEKLRTLCPQKACSDYEIYAPKINDVITSMADPEKAEKALALLDSTALKNPDIKTAVDAFVLTTQNSMDERQTLAKASKKISILVDELTALLEKEVKITKTLNDFCQS